VQVEALAVEWEYMLKLNSFDHTLAVAAAVLEPLMVADVVVAED
jgi:hypothetical protein